VIVEILVALNQAHHPLSEKLIDFMLPAAWVPVVGKTASRPLQEAHLLGYLSNQKPSGIGRNALGGKLGLDASISQALK
jgi:hypothetical protein